jgi:molybdopterin-guanine dinucleotide biosynthesis protein A
MPQRHATEIACHHEGVNQLQEHSVNQTLDRPLQPFLAAIVLAGGQSSRMGRDKALITIEGVPLLQRVCQVALTCTPTVYVITPWIERYQAIVPPACRFIEEARSVTEATPPGPLIGFAQALAQVQADWVLLLACDLPRLQAGMLQSWVTSLNQVPLEVIAMLPPGEKGWEPLCGFYRTCCLPSLESAIAQGDRSFQCWLTQISVQALPVSDRSLLLNCNTPEDLDKF